MGAGKRVSRERERWRKEGMDGMEWRGLNGEQKGGQRDDEAVRLWKANRQRLRRSCQAFGGLTTWLGGRLRN